MPEPASNEDGMIVSNMTARILEKAESYMKENCDSRGNIRGSVDKDIVTGIKMLKARADSDVMVAAAAGLLVQEL